MSDYSSPSVLGPSRHQTLCRPDTTSCRAQFEPAIETEHIAAPHAMGRRMLGIELAFSSTGLDTTQPIRPQGSSKEEQA